MAKRKPQDPTRPPTTPPEVRLSNAGQVAVTYSAKPPKGPSNKQIHPRRRLPDVPDAPPPKRDQSE
jgi:hypothetical protein